MAKIIFSRREQDYQDWCEANPDGFVVNAGRVNGYAKLHLAKCATIRRYDDRYQFGCYTAGRDYYKICSDKESELKYNDTCEHCNPLKK